MPHSSWLWLAPRPTPGSAIVLSATFSTVLSRTIAIRLMIRTPRMIQRRRRILSSGPAMAVRREALRDAMMSFRSQGMAGAGAGVMPVCPGGDEPLPGESYRYGTAPYRKTFLLAGTPVAGGRRDAPVLRASRVR